MGGDKNLTHGIVFVKEKHFARYVYSTEPWCEIRVVGTLFANILNKMKQI